MKRNFQILRTAFVTAICISSTLVLLACSPDAVPKTEPAEQGFSQKYVQGSLTLLQKTNKKEMTVADQLEVVLESSAPENMAVEFPAYSASLGDFTLIDTKKLPPRMTGTGENIRVILVTTYLLEPYLPGTYSIPKMTVTYLEHGNDATSTKLVTDNIEVLVKSLLNQDANNVEIKDIKGPLSLPENTGLQILLASIFLLVVLLAIAGFLYWRKKFTNNKPVEVQLRPEETALLELEKLLAENLLARGEVKLFHLRISDILRHYIENRFGLRAPERTTEEFLTEISLARSPKDTLLGRHKTLLADFLSHCDLVKFARHEPTITESEKTVSICREFIAETKEEKVSRGQGVEESRGKERGEFQG